MLTNEDHQKIFDAIGGEEEVPETEAPYEEQAVEAETAPAEEEPLSDSGEDGEHDEDHPHQIPYNRFREVNEERKGFRELAEEQSEKIGELQEQVERLMQGTASQQDVNEVASIFDGPEDDDWDQWRTGIASEMNELRVGSAQIELERELEYAIDHFPDVPPEAILEAVANDGTIDVLDFAESYSEFLDDIREGAVADYVQENASSTKRSARPRVNGAGSSSSGEPPKPNTMEGAQAALLRHLKEL